MSAPSSSPPSAPAPVTTRLKSSSMVQRGSASPYESPSLKAPEGSAFAGLSGIAAAAAAASRASPAPPASADRRARAATTVVAPVSILRLGESPPATRDSSSRSPRASGAHDRTPPTRAAVPPAATSPSGDSPMPPPRPRNATLPGTPVDPATPTARPALGVPRLNLGTPVGGAALGGGGGATDSPGAAAAAATAAEESATAAPATSTFAPDSRATSCSFHEVSPGSAGSPAGAAPVAAGASSEATARSSESSSAPASGRVEAGAAPTGEASSAAAAGAGVAAGALSAAAPPPLGPRTASSLSSARTSPRANKDATVTFSLPATDAAGGGSGGQRPQYVATDSERETACRAEQLDMLSLGLRAKFPRCASRSESQRHLTDAVLSGLAGSPHLSRAVDLFLAPAACGAVVSGVTWSATTLSGAVQLGGVAGDSATNANDNGGGSGFGIVAVRGTLLFATRLPSPAPHVVAAVEPLRAAMQQWAAPHFVVDLAADGPFSFSRFERATDFNAAFRPTPVADLVSMSLRSRMSADQLLSARSRGRGGAAAAVGRSGGRSQLPNSTRQQQQQQQLHLQRQQHAGDDSADGGSSGSTTSSIRFALYHARRDLVVQFRCQTSDDMLRLRRAVAAGLAAASAAPSLGVALALDHAPLPSSVAPVSVSASAPAPAPVAVTESAGHGEQEVLHSDPATPSDDSANDTERFQLEPQPQPQPQPQPAVPAGDANATGAFGLVLENPRAALAPAFGLGPSMTLFGGFAKLDASVGGAGGARLQTIAWAPLRATGAHSTSAADAASVAGVAAAESLAGAAIASRVEPGALLSRIPAFPVRCQVRAVGSDGATTGSGGAASKRATPAAASAVAPARSAVTCYVAATTDSRGASGAGVIDHVSLWELVQMTAASSAAASSSSPASATTPSLWAATVVRALVAQLAVAIALAHRRGVVVGPLTPARVLYFFRRPDTIDAYLGHSTTSDDVASPQPPEPHHQLQQQLHTPPAQPVATSPGTAAAGGAAPATMLLPPMHATLVGAGEPPSPPHWRSFRASPAVLPFLPPSFLREAVARLACAERDRRAVDGDRWTQADDLASLGCLMFWLRTGRPLHADASAFTLSTHHSGGGGGGGTRAALAPTSGIAGAAATPAGAAAAAAAAAASLSGHVAALIDGLDTAERYTATNWRAVLAALGAAPTASEWNINVYRNLTATCNEGGITPAERSLLLRLLQLPDGGGSAAAAAGTSSPSSSFAGSGPAGVALPVGSGGSRSSSRNNTPRTCRNTEAPTATDVLLHPYFAHVNFCDVFLQDPTTALIV